MFIQNISGETQTSVETYLYSIGTINVLSGQVFQCDDEQGIWLAQAYKDIFKIVGIYSGGGEANTASNLPGGAGLYFQKIGQDLQFKSLIAGTAINFSVTNDAITINSTAEANTMINLGAGAGIYYQKVGGEFQMKSLIAGTNVSLTTTNNDITINSTAEANTMINLGTGEGVYYQKVGNQFRMKSLIAGTNITFTTTNDDITINAAGGTGEVNTASNLVGDEGIYSTKVGSDLRFKSLTAGTGITLTPTANDIIITASGGSVTGAVGSNRADLAFGSAATVNVGTAVPINAIVTKIIVNVATAFDGTATVEFGDSGDTDRLVENREVNLNTAGVYTIHTYHLYTASTQIAATYAAGGATVGAANILMEYSTI